MTTTGAAGRAAPGEAPGRVGRRRPGGILPIVVVLVVLLLAEGAVRAGRSQLAEPELWPTPELQDKYTRIEALADLGGRPDVVLVGDSMMDAGGDAAALGRAGGLGVYNASISGETLPVIADWTTMVVMPRLRPKVVVLGLSSNELNPRVLAPETGVAAYRASRVVRVAQGTGSLVDRADAVLAERSMLYRYRSSLRRPLGAKPVDPDAFVPKLTPEGHNVAFADVGYLQKYNPVQAQAVIQGVVGAHAGFTVNPENVAILQELIRSVRRQGARVLLVAMPVTANLLGYHPRGAADYEDAMTAFAGAAERSGATFVQPGIWPDEQFADPVHVNGAGAARLTDYLAPLVGREVAKADEARP